MNKTTRWRPDTCDCVLEYTWDDELPEAERTHAIERVVPCAIHQGLADDEVRFTAVQTENVGKNRALASIAAALPADLGVEVVDRDGNVQYSPSDELSSSWAFDQDRKLVVRLPSLDPQKVAQAQDAARDSGIEVTVTADAVAPAEAEAAVRLTRR